MPTQVKGARKLYRNLTAHQKLVADSLEAVLLAVAPIVHNAIAAKAPIDIGQDVVTQTTERSPKRVVVAVGPSADKWYAHFWEYGTKAHTVKIKTARALHWLDRFARSVQVPGIRKQPYMRPAIDENEQRVIAAAGDAFKKAAKL